MIVHMQNNMTFLVCCRCLGELLIDSKKHMTSLNLIFLAVLGVTNWLIMPGANSMKLSSAVGFSVVIIKSDMMFIFFLLFSAFYLEFDSINYYYIPLSRPFVKR